MAGPLLTAVAVIALTFAVIAFITITYWPVDPGSSRSHPAKDRPTKTPRRPSPHGRAR